MNSCQPACLSLPSAKITSMSCHTRRPLVPLPVLCPKHEFKPCSCSHQEALWLTVGSGSLVLRTALCTERQQPKESSGSRVVIVTAWCFLTGNRYWARMRGFQYWSSGTVSEKVHSVGEAYVLRGQEGGCVRSPAPSWLESILTGVTVDIL